MWLFRAHFSVKLLSHKWHVNFLHEGERKRCKYYPHGTEGPRQKRVLTLKCGECTDFVRRTAGLVCHVCITRHWFFCRGLALQPFILCFAVGPNGFEKFCYSPVTPEANVRIDFTCTGLHHLSRAWAVRAKAKWKAIHTKLLRQPLLSARRRRLGLPAAVRAGAPPGVTVLRPGTWLPRTAVPPGRGGGGRKKPQGSFPSEASLCATIKIH